MKVGVACENSLGALIFSGKIGKIVSEFLAKGHQVGPYTFVWANLVLQLSNLGSVISLIQLPLPPLNQQTDNGKDPSSKQKKNRAWTQS